MENLKEKNIIVTGASGGIGNAIVEYLLWGRGKYFSHWNKNWEIRAIKK